MGTLPGTMLASRGVDKGQGRHTFTAEVEREVERST